ncbi:MAG: MFS transporter [Pirellulales bacterium]
MMNDRAREFTTFEGFAFFVAMIGVQLASELFAQWGTYFYSPSTETGRTVYVSIAIVAYIFMLGRVIDVFTDPLIGVWSDRLGFRPGRWRIVPLNGRRRPFIFWGSLLMTFTGIAFWFPPVDGESSLNFYYGAVLMSLHWTMYTLAYIPILALAPEIARSRSARVKLGTWIGVGMIVGLLCAALLPGQLISMLDPARQVGEGSEPHFSAVGYQRVAVLFAVVTLCCFQFFVWAVSEREIPGQVASTTPAIGELARTFQVPAFRLYFVIFFLFYLGTLANQRAIPYWADLGLGGDEGTVSLLGIPFAVTCLVAAFSCPWLCRRFELKWLVVTALGLMTIGMPLMYFIAIMDADFKTKLGLGMSVYALKGAGLGMMYVLVTPLIGEIIDLAEKRFGERREAVFNAMHAVIVKTAQVFGIWVAVSIMGQFGNSVSQPTGAFLVAPISSVFCFIAMIAACSYPVIHPVAKPDNFEN